MKHGLTSGPVGPQLVKLTLPMVWGFFVFIASNLVQIYCVGQLGTAQLAAMSFTFPVELTLDNLAFGLGMGTTTLVARAIGQGDMRLVQRFTTNSLTLALTVVLLFACVGLFTIDPLFKAMGASPDILPFIREYMRIWYFSIVFLVVPMVGNSSNRAAGNTLAPSIIVTIAAGTNILLSPLLINGTLGFPRLELQGAALASLIAWAISLVATLLVMHFQESLLSSHIPNLKETLSCWCDILRVWIRVATASAIAPISIGVITRFLSTHGEAAVAGFGLASEFESLALIAVVALASGMGPFIGQNWGAQQIDRVSQALVKGYCFCLGWGVLMAVVLSVNLLGDRLRDHMDVRTRLRA